MKFDQKMYYWMFTPTGVVLVSIIIFGQSSSGLTKTLQLMSEDGSILVKLDIYCRDGSTQLEYDSGRVHGRFLFAIVISAVLLTTSVNSAHLLRSFVVAMPGAPIPGSS